MGGSSSKEDAEVSRRSSASFAKRTGGEPLPLTKDKKASSIDSAIGNSPPTSPKTSQRASGIFGAPAVSFGADSQEKPVNVDLILNDNLGVLRKQITEAFMERASDDRKQAWAMHMRELRKSTLIPNAVREGQKAPDFELLDQKGNTIKLSSLLSNGPVVLVFLRGSWCPFCMEYIKRLQQALPSFQRLRASVVAVTTEAGECVRTGFPSVATFSVCSDSGRDVARSYGLLYEVPDIVVDMYKEEFKVDWETHFGTDKPSYLTLTPTYTIDPDGIISYAYVDADFSKRAPIMQLVHTLSWQP